MPEDVEDIGQSTMYPREHSDEQGEERYLSSPCYANPTM
jgi:hypothetical protein